MKLNTPIVLIFLAIINPSQSYAEIPLGYLSFSGGGSNIASNLDRTLIPVYDSPNGKQIGTISSNMDLGLCFYTNGSINALNIEEPNEKTKRHYDYYNYGGKCSALTYYEISGQYARILASHIDGGVWINMKYVSSDNPPVKFSLAATEGFTNNLKYARSWEVSGYNRYRLRKSPSLDGEVIIILNERRHVFKEFTGNIKDHWAEGVVYLLNQKPDGCYDKRNIKEDWIKDTWTGWIKVLDDNGMPGEIRWASLC